MTMNDPCKGYLHPPVNAVVSLRYVLERPSAPATLLDLHGPSNGPKNGPCEANFRGPFVKQGPPGSLDGPNWSIFFIDL